MHHTLDCTKSWSNLESHLVG